ncbi:MAG: hypothetical protein JSS79_08415 [Bacteroidetes bacterium]|nr:hypothetical protein [Bacteroidota bacterium]
MALKISKVLWVFSLLAATAFFMYVYASLPETVVVNENTFTISLSKEAVFYIALALITIANALVFLVTRIYPEKDFMFKAWFYVLIIWVNLFFVIGLNFISLYNSGEKYDYGRLGAIIYGSVAILLIWIAVWPIYRIAQNFSKKQTV